MEAAAAEAAGTWAVVVTTVLAVAWTACWTWAWAAAAARAAATAAMAEVTEDEATGVTAVALAEAGDGFVREGNVVITDDRTGRIHGLRIG